MEWGESEYFYGTSDLKKTNPVSILRETSTFGGGEEEKANEHTILYKISDLKIGGEPDGNETSEQSFFSSKRFVSVRLIVARFAIAEHDQKSRVRV